MCGTIKEEPTQTIIIAKWVNKMCCRRDVVIFMYDQYEYISVQL